MITEWETDLINTDNAKQILYRYNVIEYRTAYLLPDMY